MENNTHFSTAAAITGTITGSTLFVFIEQIQSAEKKEENTDGEKGLRWLL